MQKVLDKRVGILEDEKEERKESIMKAQQELEQAQQEKAQERSDLDNGL